MNLLTSEGTILNSPKNPAAVALRVQTAEAMLKTAAQILGSVGGRKGGKSRSRAKVAAARRNGRKSKGPKGRGKK